MRSRGKRCSWLRLLLAFGFVCALNAHFKKFEPVPSKTVLNHSTLNSERQVHIVIVTHDALPFAKKGFRSLLANTDWANARLSIVDSGSNAAAQKWFKSFCEPSFCSFTALGNIGYTRAVNFGVQQATAEFTVVMNPDVLVCYLWLEKLMEALNSCPNHAMVGPLSNAASFQSVPRVFDERGNLAVNDLPGDFRLVDMCRLVEEKSGYDFPSATFINGFLMLFRRSAYDAVGGFDEENFPIGYGEENDFSMRLLDAGYSLAIADNTYAYHFKTTGFTKESRTSLSQAGSAANKNKHGEQKYLLHVNYMKSTISQLRVRRNVANALRKHYGSSSGEPEMKKIVFISSAAVRSHQLWSSSAYIVREMRNRGLNAALAVPKMDVVDHNAGLPDNTGMNILVEYTGISDLRHVCADAHVVVATSSQSLITALKIRDEIPRIFLAFLIQNYEGSLDAVNTASDPTVLKSYEVAKENRILCFAQTNFVERALLMHHGLHAIRVPMNLHAVDSPHRKCSDSVVRLCAIFREPMGSELSRFTLTALKTLKKKFDSEIHVSALHFNVRQREEKDDQLLEFGAYSHDEVQQQIQRTDILVDLSSSLNEGRDVAVCMASDCVPVVEGRMSELFDASHTLMVNSHSSQEIFSALDRMIAGAPHTLNEAKMHARIQAEEVSTVKTVDKLVTHLTHATGRSSLHRRTLTSFLAAIFKNLLFSSFSR